MKKEINPKEASRAAAFDLWMSAPRLQDLWSYCKPS